MEGGESVKKLRNATFSYMTKDGRWGRVLKTQKCNI